MSNNIMTYSYLLISKLEPINFNSCLLSKMDTSNSIITVCVYFLNLSLSRERGKEVN